MFRFHVYGAGRLHRLLVFLQPEGWDREQQQGLPRLWHCPFRLGNTVLGRFHDLLAKKECPLPWMLERTFAIGFCNACGLLSGSGGWRTPWKLWVGYKPYKRKRLGLINVVLHCDEPYDMEEEWRDQGFSTVRLASPLLGVSLPGEPEQQEAGDDGSASVYSKQFEKYEGSYRPGDSLSLELFLLEHAYLHGFEAGRGYRILGSMAITQGAVKKAVKHVH